MNNPLITIAIPAYNNEKTIKKTIDSCLAQKTDIEYEILIVDDASQDGTLEIINRYDDRKIRAITLEERVPLIANHNVCLNNAQGEYVIFCHADDALESHAITTIEHKLKARNYPKKYIVWGHSQFRDFSAKAIDLAGFTYNEIAVGEYAPIMFLYGGLTPTGTCYSREAFVNLGGFLEVTLNSAPSDMTTMIYLALHGFRFEMIDEMIILREHSSTALDHPDISIYLGELDDAFKFFLDHVTQQDIRRLIKISSEKKNKPFYFYYAIAQDQTYRQQIKMIMFKNILKYPLRLGNPMIRKLIKRLY